MKISIITVSYNAEETIEESIKSVLSQAYDDIEYIIIDGGSTDDTVKIVEKYRKSLQYFVSEPDKGIYDAMNKGIMVSSGDVIGILNSDDIYENSNVLDLVMSQFLKDSMLDILYGNLVYVSYFDVNNIIRKWISRDYYGNFFESADVPPHPTLFLKSKIYKEVGLFNLDFKLAADYEIMLRIFKKNQFRIKFVDKVLVRMRLGGATNKNLINILKGNYEIFQSWKANNLKMPLLFFPQKLFKRIIQFL